jgi:hypothetical protein
MLEAQVSFSVDLDPYIVWYNGNRRIGEGLVSAGASRLLWKAPQQTGFHTIRAELFPFKSTKNQKGKIRELSLPVSAKNEGAEFSSASAENFLYWYQFAGDLLDSRSGVELKREPALQNTGLSWYPAEQIYGLVLGKDDSYEAIHGSFEIPENTGGDLRFLIHFIPLEQGTIFTAVLGTAANPLTITLSRAEEALLLSLESREQKSVTGKSLENTGSEPAFIDAEIHVKIQGTGVGAYFESPELFNSADPFFPEQAEILLTEPVSGELRSWLGSRAVPGKQTENTDSAATEKNSAVPVEPAGVYAGLPPRATMVVDDFTAIFRKITSTETIDSSAPDSDPLTVSLVEDSEV